MNYPWMDEYLMKKFGVTRDFKAEWGWHRYMVGGKLFCALCLDGEGKPCYITLKLAPARGDAPRQLYPDIIPGYYMNKTHWNSVRTEGAVPPELLKEMLDEAYGLVFNRLPRKKQQEINLEESK